MYEEVGKRSGAPVRYAVPRAGHFSVPVEFWTNGWVHALTSSEIANWLMYRHRDTLVPSPSPEFLGHAVDAHERGAVYGLTRDMWETHQTLSAFGLLDVTPDPDRRDDGTMIDFSDIRDRGHLHRIKVNLAGLEQPAVKTVLDALS
jgi:hypothetical protein